MRKLKVRAELAEELENARVVQLQNIVFVTKVACLHTKSWAVVQDEIQESENKYREI